VAQKPEIREVAMNPRLQIWQVWIPPMEQQRAIVYTPGD
jgi:hypothetical protein